MIEEDRYRNLNWPAFVLVLIVMIILLFYFDRAIAQDPKSDAMRVAEKTITAMGGMDSWKSVAAVRFNFQVEPKDAPARAVKHLWDRKSGRDHVEAKTREGKDMVVWVDLSKKTGAAWADGKKLEGEEKTKALEWAVSRWINDTYWMIMPFKLLDSGVNMKYEGVKDGHEILHLSFGKVGETPGDQYWAHINKETGLMDRWEYELQDKTKGDWNWVDWQKLGNVTLSRLKKSADQKVAIRFEPLQVLDSADASYFTEELKRLE